MIRLVLVLGLVPLAVVPLTGAYSYDLSTPYSYDVSTPYSYDLVAAPSVPSSVGVATVEALGVVTEKPRDRAPNEVVGATPNEASIPLPIATPSVTSPKEETASPKEETVREVPADGRWYVRRGNRWTVQTRGSNSCSSCQGGQCPQ